MKNGNRRPADPASADARQKGKNHSSATSRILQYRRFMPKIPREADGDKAYKDDTLNGFIATRFRKHLSAVMVAYWK